MKHSYILATMLLLSLVACRKDESTPADHPLPQITVGGLQTTYTVNTYRDTLRIRPDVSNEALYDFYWTAFTTNFVQGTGKVNPGDTIGRTKNLDYAVQLTPGQYILILNVRHKQTGVTQLINRPMQVSTLNMNGWYLLKDEDSRTDMDFVYQGGRINNWISFYNNGKSLDGNAVKAVFVPQFKLSLNSTDLFSSLFVLSERDAMFCRIDNGKVVKSFDDMFFSKPATRKLQNAYQPVATTNVMVMNDNQMYNMSKGALFSNYPPSAYRLSTIGAVAALPIGFDENTKSVMCFDGPNYVALQSNGDTLKKMNKDLLWMNGYAGSRSVAMALFRNPDDSGALFKLNGQYGYLGGNTKGIVMGAKHIAPSHGLMKASIRAGYYDADLIFYAVGNQIYRTDMSSLIEAPQITLAAGETVTCIQHIKYPQPATTVVTTVDKLAVATYANGRYKVWLYGLTSTGNIQPQASPDIEGNGRVTTITYIENGNGNRIF